MKNKKGNTLIIIISIIAIISITAFILFTRMGVQQSNNPSDNVDTISNTESTLPVDSGEYQGVQLAGTASPLFEFNETDYQKALDENKTIFLEFNANWCPICRAEAPDIESGFDQLNNPNVVGFKVHYNDDQATEAEKALAKEFEITYQHTKVVLKNGKEVLKNGEVWDTERFLEEMNGVL